MTHGTAHNQSTDETPLKDEQTEERIHDHLADEQDEISIADIANVKTDFGSTTRAIEANNTGDAMGDDNDVKPTEHKVHESNKSKEDDAPAIDTGVWNILGS